MSSAHGEPRTHATRCICRKTPPRISPVPTYIGALRTAPDTLSITADALFSELTPDLGAEAAVGEPTEVLFLKSLHVEFAGGFAGRLSMNPGCNMVVELLLSEGSAPPPSNILERFLTCCAILLRYRCSATPPAASADEDLGPGQQDA